MKNPGQSSNEPHMILGEIPPPHPRPFREEDHHLRFIGWTHPESQKYPITWYECEDCGQRFSEAHPTTMPPLTDCPKRKAPA